MSDVKLAEVKPSETRSTENQVRQLKPMTLTLAESVFAIDLASKIEIDVTEGMSAIVDKCIAELVKTGLVFDRGRILVAIDRDNSIHTMTKATVRFALSKIIKFVKSTYNKGTLITEPANAPAYVGEIIIALTKWHGMPVVDAITDHPVITLDGRLLGAGYDPSTRIFGRFDPCNFSVPENPTKADAVSALQTIKRLLQTLEFEHDGDESAALSSMLTAVCRPVLITALMILIDATTSGSGKGYLGGLFARLSEDKEPAAKQMKADDAEMDKQILSVLIAARPVCFFDELGMAEIDLPSLRTFASAPLYGGRLLGLNKDVEFLVRTFVLATGNNVSPTADMARRTLHIRLDPQCENPSLREFKYLCDDPAIKSAAQDVRKNRNYFISCILTIQKAYLLAQARGETTDPGSTNGGFEDWDTLCRKPVFWLTGTDPCHRMIKTMMNNPAKNELLTVMSAWLDVFGSSPKKAVDALNNYNFAAVCNDTIKRKPGTDVNSISLGLWIKKHKGQIVEGHCFVEHATVQGTQYWSVR